MADEVQIIAFPMDDTWYTAMGLGAWHGGWTSGIFSDNDHLPVKPAGGMNVTLGSGLGNLKREKYWSVSFLIPETITFTLDRAHTSLPRYDVLCVRLNKNMEKPEVIYRPGTPSARPVYPAITRGGLDADEIYPGAIYVRAGATQITAADIEPLHLNETYCGAVRDGVHHIPTQQLYDAWLSWFTQTKQTGDNEVAALLEYGRNFRIENTEGMATWRQEFEETQNQRADTFYNGFTSANLQRANEFLTQWMAENSSRADQYFNGILSQLDENQVIELANMIYRHEQTGIMGTGVHGQRIKDGKLQVDIGIGWATLMAIPQGWTANYIKAKGYTWDYLKAAGITWGELHTLIEVEAQ